MTDKTEQWNLDGDCDLCRRKKYCSKPCTKAKRQAHAETKRLVKQILNEATGGVLGDAMNKAVDTVMM